MKDGAELAEKPGGPAVAKLAAEVAVEVVGSRGAHSKILIAEGAYVIFGWVKVAVSVSMLSSVVPLFGGAG